MLFCACRRKSRFPKLQEAFSEALEHDESKLEAMPPNPYSRGASIAHHASMKDINPLASSKELRRSTHCEGQIHHMSVVLLTA